MLYKITNQTLKFIIIIFCHVLYFTCCINLATHEAVWPYIRSWLTENRLQLNTGKSNGIFIRIKPRR